jgi:hypothetical protein
MHMIFNIFIAIVDWIRNRLVVQRREITGSVAHGTGPKRFPEGELLDSPGFAAQRLPWVRDIHKTA